MHHVSPVLSALPGAIHSPAPALGERTPSLLENLGYGQDGIDALATEGVT